MACPTSAGAASQRGSAGLMTALQLSRNVTFCLSAGERFASTLTAFSRCPRFWHEVEITQERFGPLHLAMGRPLNSKERWIVISDEPTSLETFREYGLRFDIEDNFLDDKSNGFQLEASLIRSAPALERLCLVLAVATLYLGQSRNAHRRDRTTTTRRCPLVSWQQLSQDRMELDPTRRESKRKAADPCGPVSQTRSRTGDGVSKTTRRTDKTSVLWGSTTCGLKLNPAFCQSTRLWS